jgi:hypothetical protein
MGQRSRMSTEQLRPFLSTALCFLHGTRSSARERGGAIGRIRASQWMSSRVLFRDNQLRFNVPLARDPTEARRIALDVIARFSADNTPADVRVTRYD